MSPSTVGRRSRKKTVAVKKEKSFGRGILRQTTRAVLGIAMVGSAIATGAAIGLVISFRNLPDVRVLNSFVPTETTFIYDVKGRELTSLHGEANRKLVKLEQVSPELKRALLAIEDSNFYHHHGINLISVGRALMVNAKSGGVVEGASTLTMQLVKNVFLEPQRAIARKMAEAVLAIRIEQVFEKDEILQMYLNNIYWGHNNYGVETASESYFNKPASDLTLPEAAMLAGLVQSPEIYSPFRDYAAAKKRQATVLNRMADLGWITPQEAEEARLARLGIGKPTAWQSSKLPYVTDAVILELNRRFGKETVVKGGMRIQTTIDYNFQKLAEEKVKQGYASLRGKGVSAKELQIALVAVDPRTHFVKAIVGGVDYNKSQLNRAIQSRRQPGSSFKPFVYYTAFASGKYTPASIVRDAPVRYRDGSGYYSPKNYGGGYSGAMSIRTALVQSTNIPAIVVGQKVGISKVIELCKRLGIESPLQAVISLPLGAVEVTPLEMANAFATFASNGWYEESTIILRVTDSQGNVLLDNTPHPQLVLDPWAAASLTTVLKGVINGGTGKSAYIGRPAAGKTGTTDNERNVWFVGYVPQLSTAVWVGDDSNRPLGKGVSGGTHAAPVWRNFMQAALKDQPVEHFPAASNFPAPAKQKK